MPTDRKKARRAVTNFQPIGVAAYPTVSERRVTSNIGERTRDLEKIRMDDITAILKSHREEARNKCG